MHSQLRSRKRLDFTAQYEERLYLIDQIGLKEFDEILVFPPFACKIEGTIIKLNIEIKATKRFIDLI